MPLKKCLTNAVTLGAAIALAFVRLTPATAEPSDTPSSDAPGTCWEVSTKSQIGESKSRFIITQSGEHVSGTWLTSTGAVPLTGTMKGNDVALGMTMATLGQDLKVTYNGTLQGDSISGTSDLGDLGSGTFVATKPCTGPWKPVVATWSAAPKNLDFNDHEGFISIFDGTLNGWDGNRKFWRVENGMIIGESTHANPSGHAYLTYRNLTAHDFDLRMEIKIENGGSGIQYRSHTGTPWRGETPPDVVANAGKYDPNWMMTGPQADFWSPVNTMLFAFNGQVVSENTPIGIEAFTGQVVRQYGEDISKKKLVATIAPSRMLTGSVNVNGWNQYEIIARGGVFIHIMNGQLMAVLIDDDPKSTNQAAGLFGLEVDGFTKVLARNIYVRKLN